jgi:hypothetical protein
VLVDCPGASKLNQRLGQIIHIVLPSSPPPAEVASKIRYIGIIWNEGRQSKVAQDGKLRKSVWGSFAEASGEVSIIMLAICADDNATAVANSNFLGTGLAMESSRRHEHSHLPGRYHHHEAHVQKRCVSGRAVSEILKAGLSCATH